MNERRIPVRLLAALSLALPASTFASPLHAQDPDAARAIQELARKIDEQMKEIDRLLLETSKQKGGEAKAPPKESLSRTREQSQIVEKSIDELIQKLKKKDHRGNADECWLLAAAEAKLPIVVPGYEDSTFGNIFAAHVKVGDCNASIAKSGIEYMGELYDQYQVLSEGPGVGFFQIGGGIAGDFPICVVPSLKYDMESEAKPWAYFCQISDSTTSYGSYSGATPNEKITWDKLTEDTPMFVIESDATIVVPLMLSALLECKRHPKEAAALINGFTG